MASKEGGTVAVLSSVGAAASTSSDTPSRRRSRASSRPSRRAASATPTRSHAERKLLALLRRAGLPPSATNAHIAGHEVDVLYATRRVVVEMDGLAFHATHAAAERDRTKDAALRTSGYEVLRFTWRQVTERPESVAATVAVALNG